MVDRLQQLRQAADNRINYGHDRVWFTKRDMQILGEFEDLLQAWYEIECEVDAYENTLRQQVQQGTHPQPPTLTGNWAPTQFETG